MSTQRFSIPIYSVFQLDDDDENKSFADLSCHFIGGNEEVNTILQNETLKLEVDESIKNDVRLAQSEITTLTHDVVHSKEFLDAKDETDISELEAVGRVTNKVEQFLDTLNVTCETCITYEKVTHITEIKPGNHIRFRRMCIGINVYNHHAIAIEVKHDINDTTKGEMTLVHFHKNNRGVITVVKETEQFDMATENIDIVKYKSLSYTAEQIIETANKMADKFKNGRQAESYSILGNNCEDKSNEIATGAKFSQQVSKVATYVKSTITWLLKLFLKIAIKFFNRVKTYIRGFAHIVVICSLLTIIDQIASLKSKLNTGFLCLKCYQKERTQLMISLLFCLISVGISVVSHVGLTYFAINTVIATALPVVSSLICDAVMPFIHPAYNVSKQIVRRIGMLRKGDVITFPYCGLGHEGVITEVDLSDNQSDVVEVKVVHFNYPGIFGTRTVVEGDFFFDLARKYVYVYDFNGKETYQSEEVVTRAREKIGSQNFHMIHNNSSHLSRYCKTGKRKPNKLPYMRASQMTDLSPGDVINFSYYWFPHDAVVIKVKYPETIKCSVVHYNYGGLLGTRTIVEESFQFKVSDQNVFVHDYSEYNVYKQNDVVARAKSRIGEQKFDCFTNRSSHLARWCKIKQSDKT